jgi:hypothetical protein
MYSIEKELDVPIEWELIDDKVTIEITFHANGEIVSILVDGKMPDEQITKVINEDLREIQGDICWFLRNEGQDSRVFYELCIKEG